MNHLALFSFLALAIFACNPIKKENRELVEIINHKTRFIDDNERISIIEDDFHDSVTYYKVRAYTTDKEMIKLVAIVRTASFERDDYFYFENEKLIFSGHVVNEKTDHMASEYKYYYEEGKLKESLFWKDHYEPGKHFPHENFKEFEPNTDSVERVEKERLDFYIGKLDTEGIELEHINENLDANTLEQ